MAEERKVSLKLLVDTKARKVLFAEAGKDFVDFIFHILSLPIGTAVELLNQKGMVGCLGDLCKSIEDLDSNYVQSNVTKDLLLKPVVTRNDDVKVSFSLLMDAPTPAKKFYTCTNHRYSSCRNNVTDGQGATCPQCNGPMSSEMSYAPPTSSTEAATSSGGGYVKGLVTYMVMDNLEVKPMSTISCITLINNFNVKDLASLVEKEVQVGLNEGLAILKASLETRAALTEAFLSVKVEKN